MRKRIFRGMCALSLACVLLACVCAIGVLYRFSFDSMRSRIRDEAIYLAAAINNGAAPGQQGVGSATNRVTLVEPDGSVVYDSAEDPAGMDDHSDRPEIIEAMSSGASEARRYSTTLSQTVYYRAVRLQDGRVLRVSGSMDSVWMTSLRYLPFFIAILFAALAGAALLARTLSRRISEPLNQVDLENPLAHDVYEELSPLLRRMERQREQISEQLRYMEGQRREFEAITAHMREGLILVGVEQDVLSINKSAAAALGLDAEECLGRHILNMSRDDSFQRAVRQSLQGRPGEASLTLGGKEYQILANPVEGGDAINGAVILLLDVTEKSRAEQLRREFTANVSHELKTPLTSISGFAELMKDGMVKSPDVPEFASRVYKEAQRLIVLVDDILRLSSLDERSGLREAERVELLSLARDVTERLKPVAAERGVTLEVSGSEAAVNGVPLVLEEIIFNLCDNSIKYNIPGGAVDVRVGRRPEGLFLTVTDTGIGIPREQQSRVFERFYRVDKSHARETGGTGLGLSIVKHGAMLHSARVELRSEVGKGTEVAVIFPAT